MLGIQESSQSIEPSLSPKSRRAYTRVGDCSGVNVGENRLVGRVRREVRHEHRALPMCDSGRERCKPSAGFGGEARETDPGKMTLSKSAAIVLHSSPSTGALSGGVQRPRVSGRREREQRGFGLLGIIRPTSPGSTEGITSPLGSSSKYSQMLQMDRVSSGNRRSSGPSLTGRWQRSRLFEICESSGISDI